MTTEKRVGKYHNFDTEGLSDNINQCLQGILDPKHPHHKWHGESGISRPVLYVIQAFIEWSYWFGSNPIPRLKKSCPDFEWKFWSYVELEDTDDCKKMEGLIIRALKKSDFFWPMPTVSVGRWVTARKKKTRRIPQCRSGNLGRDSTEIMDSYKLVRLAGFIMKAREKSIQDLHESFQDDIEHGKFVL